MNDSLYDELQKAATKALNSSNMEEGMEHLARAFSLFSKESKKWKSSYLDLKADLQKAYKELDQSHKELQQTNKEHKLTSLYLSSLLKNISQGVLFLHKDGTVLAFNEAAEKILKISGKKVLFQKYTKFFKDDFFGFSLKDALDYGIISNLSYVTLFPSEEKKEIEVNSSFLSSEENPYEGILLVLKDVTDLERLKALNHQSSRLKELGEMAATIAHEIKNPLGGVRGYAALLYRDLKDYPKLQEMAHNIVEGVKHLDRLVANVLHFSRPIDPKIVTVDLAMFLRKTCKFLKMDPSFPQNIQLEIHISQEPFMAPIDPDAMRGCLWNLIINAMQAMPEGGLVTLSLLKQDQTAILSVADTGCGISEKNLEEIFSPFFTTKEKGNGLGLAEAHKIIQAHHGKMEVRSKLGKGTVFTLSLPLRR